MTVELIPIRGIPEVRRGDDLPALIAAALQRQGVAVEDGDALAVTQKVVSKAEGRIVPAGDGGGKAAAVAAESVRVVAAREGLVVAETPHGFVCANAGVDASNVAEGFLSLLPEDPDGSAALLRAGLEDRTGRDLAVVITDTFGRAWRRGVVNVAIGCAGLPALVDLRGTRDAGGRVLEATIVALADEVAAASGLVMGKSDGVPVALVRGVRREAPALPGSALVRPPAEDLFRESPLQSIHARRSIRRFGPGEVTRQSLREAVRAACTAPAPHHTRPWMFVFLPKGPARLRLLVAMAEAWRADLSGDGTPSRVIERRLAKSDRLLGDAPYLAIPFVQAAGAHRYPDRERRAAEQQMFLLSGGAAIQNLLLALHDQGLASCWVSSTLFCKEETREALGLGPNWMPIGSIAIGPPPTGSPPPRPELDLSPVARFLD